MYVIGLWMTRSIVALLIATVGGLSSVYADDNIALEPKSDEDWKQIVNHGTVRILTKGLGCTCTAIASDMASVLNETGDRRILPVIGHGSLQGIADLMYLEGVDLSILQADVLAFVQRNDIHRNIEGRVRYVTKLYNSELHLIAGAGIKTIQDLDGEVVSYDVKGRGSFITAENVFESLGVEVKPVHFERDVAIEKIRKGEIAAAFVVTGKPADSMLKVQAGDGLHFVPVPINRELEQTYLSSTMTHDDYPDLIAADEIIDTIAVPEVLAVYNWPVNHERFAKVKSVVEAFLENFDKFQDPVRHPKWKDVNLQADLPGWQRFQPAEDWLKSNIESVDLDQNDDAALAELNTDNNGVDQSEETEDGLDIQTISTTPLTITIAPGWSREGDQSLTFNISLSRPNVAEIPIVYNTIEGSAEAGLDFRRRNGVMVIEPGQTEASLDIDILDDEISEGDEDLSLIVTIDPSIADLELGPYRGVIMDND